jgi:glutamate synthase (NADPH/NADH) small chain
MLRFTNTEQSYPPQRDATERRHDFNEIYAPYTPDATQLQAERCSQCGIPFCQIHCPLQNNIPDWLQLAAAGRLREAYEMSAATNNFPEICGRICPQDRLCEGNCVIEKGFGAVTIGSVEKYITETAFAEGWVEAAPPAYETGFSVGIIGAGPTGMAAADMLRRQGHAVTIYDRYDRVGGLMIYGIPNFKLDKSVVQRREKLLRESGIEFKLNNTVGVNISLSDIRTKHNAVLIATGVYKSRHLGMANDTASNIVGALEYLTASNKRGLGDDLSAVIPAKAGIHVKEFVEHMDPGLRRDDNLLNAVGKHVVVIGGGDTAMDCVRTAVRQQAASVTCLYRRDRANMPGSAREVTHAEQEGVRFEWLSAPAEFIGNPVTEITVQRMQLSAADASGRQAVTPIAGDTHTMKADMIIQALGFDAEDLPLLWNEPALTCSRYGMLSVNATTFETSLPGVYAAGDIVRGASLVVWAIKDGRDAAAAIHRRLTVQQTKVA